VATGDFFQTGRDAVLWQSSTTGALSAWSLDGATLLATTAAGQIGSEWHVAGVGHFAGIGSGDPTGDVVWVDANNDVTIGQMSGGVFAQFVTPSLHQSSGWALQAVGDFTGSGESELLWVDNSGSAQIWQLNGSHVTVSTLPAPSNFANTAQAQASTVIGSGDTQAVGAGDTIVNPVISGGTLELMNGAIVSGPISFASGSTGTLFDADQASLPDTVVGFSEGADFLSFAGETAQSEAAVVASAQLVNGNTVLTFPDHTSVVLTGVTHIDTGIFA
jgi:hypothetical protein